MAVVIRRSFFNMWFTFFFLVDYKNYLLKFTGLTDIHILHIMDTETCTFECVICSLSLWHVDYVLPIFSASEEKNCLFLKVILFKFNINIYIHRTVASRLYCYTVGIHLY